MVSGNRQTILENNRSLRNIKSELETLLERGVVTDDIFDKIHALLPNESPLSGGSNAPSPATRNTTSPPVQPLAALSLNEKADSAPPPAYTAPSGPPPLPTRKQTAPPPSKPVVCHARALYKYDASDARDCSLEKGDRIAVHEKMNADWWMGKNLKSGQEGIFPKSYVEEDSPNEKAGGFPGAQSNGAGVGGQYPPPPQGRNPYDSSVPPQRMANANDGYGGGGQQGPKEDSTGKKMGKKFGNAAVFGAGATFGGKIINSIF